MRLSQITKWLATFTLLLLLCVAAREANQTSTVGVGTLKRVQWQMVTYFATELLELLEISSVQIHQLILSVCQSLQFDSLLACQLFNWFVNRLVRATVEQLLLAVLVVSNIGLHLWR